MLYTFVFFWMATTGEWRQYIPTIKRLIDVALYYMVGIFQGKSYPVPKSERDKHNPLQSMTYLTISLIFIPVQMATGGHDPNRWHIRLPGLLSGARLHDHHGPHLDLSPEGHVHRLGGGASRPAGAGHVSSLDPNYPPLPLAPPGGTPRHQGPSFEQSWRFGRRA